MDFKVIKGINNYIYDSIQEFQALKPNTPYVQDWRFANEKDWVLTDDDYICQILKKGTIGTKTFVRTVLGMFTVESLTVKMLGEDGIVDNIYSFSGNYKSSKLYKKNKENSKEILFARYIASGVDSIEAFKKVYPKAKKDSYIKDKTKRLLKKESVQNMIKDEIKKSIWSRFGSGVELSGMVSHPNCECGIKLSYSFLSQGLVVLHLLMHVFFFE